MGQVGGVVEYHSMVSDKGQQNRQNLDDLSTIRPNTKSQNEMLDAIISWPLLETNKQTQISSRKARR